MPKLGPVNRKEFIRKLKVFGLEGPIQGGDHQYMCGKGCKIKIPNPHKEKDVPVFIIQLVIKELGISRDDWMNA